MAGTLLEQISGIFFYSADQPLLFTRLYFWIFFFVVLLGYGVFYKKKGLRTGYLFLMSLFFYYKSGGYYFGLLIFSTFVDYFLGKWIHESIHPQRRKWLVGLSVFVNLSVLGFFKYAYFFVNLINEALGTKLEVFNFLAHWANIFTGHHYDIHQIILPVGISFYTFQTISYTVDVYRRKVKPVDNLIDFGFYVSFFPQLVAGPIVRAADFVPQIYQRYHLTAREAGHALFLIIGGLIKKILISDYISVNFVDRVFSTPSAYNGFENLMASYGYGLQIYCDFSGYTDIAIGVALLLGFRLPINFNSPYKAINITDFWRRWHISLSTWLRDYLYIPLGGNRNGKRRMHINLMITMILGGLWHGAAYRFIIWGAIHGVALVINKNYIRLRKKVSPTYSSTHIERPLHRALAIFTTFHIVTFAWLFFRAPDIAHVSTMLQQITGNFPVDLIPEMLVHYWKPFSLIAMGFVLHWLPSYWKEEIRGKFIDLHWGWKALITLIVVLIIFQASTAGLQPFIYFQF
ncbi:MAG: MBOAT family protein [Bacteroidales bacterium]